MKLLSQGIEGPNFRELDDHLTVEVFFSLDQSNVALKLRVCIEVDVLADLSEKSLFNLRQLRTQLVNVVGKVGHKLPTLLLLDLAVGMVSFSLLVG